MNPVSPTRTLLSLAVATAAAVLPTGMRAATGAFPHGARVGAAQPDGMTTYRSRHYKVVTDLEQREADEFVRHMDRVFEEYDRRFAAFPVKGGMSFPLYLFSTQQKYVEHLRGDGIDGANTAGMFFKSSEGDGLATFVGGMPRSAVRTTLQHEGFHQFAWTRIGRHVPVWANEGLAEYFGAAYLVRNRFVLGRADEGRLAGLKRAIETGKTIPFGRLLSMTDQEWGARVAGGHDETGLQYTQSWSIVHFLIDGDRGKYEGMFVKYLEGVGTGLQHQQAFGRAFGTTDYAEFEAAWKRHVERLEPDPVSTASGRLSFLARGVQGLHAAGQTPGTFEELRKALVDAKFRAIRLSHGSYTELSAEDAAMFQVPPEKPGAAAGTPELVASKDAALPPSLRARVGRLTASVVWTKDKSGEVGYDIEIE